MSEHGGEYGHRPLRSIDDLLTDEQKAELAADLAVMAKQRRAAEAFAATFVLGSGVLTGSSGPVDKAADR